MTKQNDLYTCPHCGTRARHRVQTERKVAPVMWCLQCYQVTVLPVRAETAKHPQDDCRPSAA